MVSQSKVLLLYLLGSRKNQQIKKLFSIFGITDSHFSSTIDTQLSDSYPFLKFNVLSLSTYRPKTDQSHQARISKSGFGKKNNPFIPTHFFNNTIDRPFQSSTWSHLPGYRKIRTYVDEKISNAVQKEFYDEVKKFWENELHQERENLESTSIFKLKNLPGNYPLKETVLLFMYVILSG